MTNDRPHLIVNADDFGLTEGTNRGILRAYREGILTSASLMVRCPAAQHGVEHADGLDLGLHIDLGEWHYQDGAWSAVYERVPQDNATAVEDEVRKQLDLFRRLTGNDPSHLDSHQHVHQHEPARSVIKKLASELAVPLRGQPPQQHPKAAPRISYLGSFYGQAGEGQRCPQNISVEGLVSLLRELRPGITELGCHPGEDENLESVYRLERLQEVLALCHPRVRDAIVEEEIHLTTFRALPCPATAS